MLKILGVLIVLSPFTIIGIDIVRKDGWLELFKIYGGILALIIILIIGIALIKLG